MPWLGPGQWPVEQPRSKDDQALILGSALFPDPHQPLQIRIVRST
jgi:hypothetical protein